MLWHKPFSWLHSADSICYSLSRSVALHSKRNVMLMNFTKFVVWNTMSLLNLRVYCFTRGLCAQPPAHPRQSMSPLLPLSVPPSSPPPPTLSVSVSVSPSLCLYLSVCMASLLLLPWFFSTFPAYLALASPILQNNYLIILPILPFFAFPLCARTRVVRDLFPCATRSVWTSLNSLQS